MENYRINIQAAVGLGYIEGIAAQLSFVMHCWFNSYNRVGSRSPINGIRERLKSKHGQSIVWKNLGKLIYVVDLLVLVHTGGANAKIYLST